MDQTAETSDSDSANPATEKLARARGVFSHLVGC